MLYMFYYADAALNKSIANEKKVNCKFYKTLGVIK